MYIRSFGITYEKYFSFQDDAIYNGAIFRNAFFVLRMHVYPWKTSRLYIYGRLRKTQCKFW